MCEAYLRLSISTALVNTDIKRLVNGSCLARNSHSTYKQNGKYDSQRYAGYHTTF